MSSDRTPTICTIEVGSHQEEPVSMANPYLRIGGRPGHGESHHRA